MIFNVASRTRNVRFKVITKDALTTLVALFESLQMQAPQAFPGAAAELLYEIRANDEVYSGPLAAEFWQLFDRTKAADFVRLVVQASSNPPGQPQQIQAGVALVLDRNPQNPSRLDAYGLHQNVNWVTGAFARFEDILRSIPTRNVVLHSPIFEMVLQLLVVLFITSFSVYATSKLEALIKLDYSAVYIFLVVAILLSNVWTYVANGLKALRNAFYPIVDIRERPRKPVLLTIVTFVALAAAGWAVDYALNLVAAK